MSNVFLHQPKHRSLVAKMADRFSVDPDRMMATLKSTAFKQRDGSAPTDEQMMALLVVADQYGLNPWTREIYAFPDKQNGIVPVVGVDGWSRIINSHPQFNGMEFRFSDTQVDDLPGMLHPAPEWCECIMHRKDRSHPIAVPEYLDEVYRPPFEGNGKNGPYKVNGPWQTHTRRFMRHKAMIQAARLAFGFVGIFDEDEAERIAERDMGAAERVHEEPKAPEALPEYPAEQFGENLPKWRAVIESGRKAPADIIATIESKYTMSEDQKQAVLELQTGEDE